MEDKKLGVVKMINNSKPPLGVIPEFIWVEERVKELQDAFERTNFTDCEAWIEEWNRHAS